MDITYFLLSLLSVPASWLIHRSSKQGSGKASSSWPSRSYLRLLWLSFLGFVVLCFYTFTKLIYLALSQGMIGSLGRSDSVTLFYQETNPVPYWLTVALAYVAATAAGVIFLSLASDLGKKLGR